MTPELMPSFAPALMLLALLLAAAWGAKWLRQRYAIGGSADAQAIKIVSSLVIGPQQRVVVLELTEPGTQAKHLLTVGVTPSQIATLHSTALAATDAASFAATETATYATTAAATAVKALDTARSGQAT